VLRDRLEACFLMFFDQFQCWALGINRTNDSKVLHLYVIYSNKKPLCCNFPGWAFLSSCFAQNQGSASLSSRTMWQSRFCIQKFKHHCVVTLNCLKQVSLIYLVDSPSYNVLDIILIFLNSTNKISIKSNSRNLQQQNNINGLESLLQEDWNVYCFSSLSCVFS